MDQANQFLGSEKIGSLMYKYAIPCIISLLVGALYNIVDQIFIANASYLGSYGNAANTVVFPLTVVALSIAVLVGDGCCAFVSISLGRNEVSQARHSVGNAVILAVASSLVLTALYHDSCRCSVQHYDLQFDRDSKRKLPESLPLSDLASAQCTYAEPDE